MNETQSAAERRERAAERRWAMEQALLHVGMKAASDHTYARSILSFIRGE